MFSFTQLTINAEDHRLMSRFHRPGEDKRSLFIVPSGDYDDWLDAKTSNTRTYLQPYLADLVAGELMPKVPSVKQSELF